MKASVMVACSLILALFSTPAFVHHSAAMFDLTKSLTIHGTIVDFHWSNPHANFRVSVVKPNGHYEIWGIEMDSPNNLIREGWKRTTIKPGDKVTVTVRPLRDGLPGGRYVAIVLPDGKVLGGEQKQR